MNTLDSLTRHACWANRTWLEFTYGLATPDPYHARMISHIELAEKIWFQRVDGLETDKDVFVTLPKADLLMLADTHERRYAELGASDLARSIAYRKLNGDPQQSALGDILIHLAMHGSHHRGQMATHASQQELDAPDTMYIAFTRLKS